jgi:RNA polymerase sigma-70 factor (ECF subfamily)
MEATAAIEHFPIQRRNPPPKRRQHRNFTHMSNTGQQTAAADGPPDLVGLLVAISERQDRAAFSGLFAHFAPRVKAYLIRHGATNETAEELAQETLLRVWRKAHLFDPAVAAPSTWIFRIARNLRIDRIRRERRPEFDPEDPVLVRDADPAADQQIETNQEGARIRAAIDLLPPDQKQAIMLSFFEDKPHSEIADELGLPLGTVKSRIRLAFARVRQTLGDER